MTLESYKDTVGFLAMVVTIGQQFAPAFLCKDIIRDGHTNNVESTPFVGGLVMCVLMLENGLLLDDSMMITVNICCLFLNIVYFLIYYKYTQDKQNVHSLCKKGAGFVAVMVAYAQMGEKESVLFYYSLVVTICMFVLISSPLFALREIIESKSTAKMPFPLILSGTVVTFLWLLYGIIIENVFIQVQNVVGFILCTVQLSLFVIYPNKPTTKIKTN